jgi:hypothetical protein
MTDRRRTQRFVLGPPLAADAMCMQDVVLERMDDTRITLISLTPHEPGARTVVNVSTPAGMQSHRTSVLSSTPIAVGASVQFRIELHIDASAGTDGGS